MYTSTTLLWQTMAHSPNRMGWRHGMYDWRTNFLAERTSKNDLKFDYSHTRTQTKSKYNHEKIHDKKLNGHTYTHSAPSSCCCVHCLDKQEALGTTQNRRWVAKYGGNDRRRSIRSICLMRHSVNSRFQIACFHPIKTTYMKTFSTVHK